MTSTRPAPSPAPSPAPNPAPNPAPPDAEDDWLDPDVSLEHALSLLAAYPAGAMRSVAVSPLVNSVKNDGPELLEPAV